MTLMPRRLLAAVPGQPVGGGLDRGAGPDLTAFDGTDTTHTWDDAISGGLTHGTTDELQAQNAFLLGVIVQRDIRELADRYRAGRLTDSENQRLTRYARQWWADKAATPEHVDAAVDRARAVGRGEVT